MAKKKKDRPKPSYGEIAWETAEVRGGSLVVAVSGDVSKAWRKRLASVMDRLSPAGSLGVVEITRGKLTVAGVAEGREADLRHVLEGAVQQTNSDLAPPQETDPDARSQADAAMTATFRSFARPDVGPSDTADAPGDS